MSLERELKRALRAQDPGEAFTARVLERIKQERGDASTNASHARTAAPDGPKMNAGSMPHVQTEGGVHGSRPAPGVPLPQNVEPFMRRTSPETRTRTATHVPRSRTAWFAAVAATLALTVGGAQWVKHRQEMAEGERARAEVLTALRLTSAKLSIVRAAVAESDGPRGETAH